MKKVAYILFLTFGLSSIQFLYAENILALSTKDNNITIRAYPNPASGVINVQVNGDYDIQFYDLVGQKISLETTERNYFGDSKNISYNIQSLPQGIYFIKVFDKISKTQKMVKFKKL